MTPISSPVGEDLLVVACLCCLQATSESAQKDARADPQARELVESLLEDFTNALPKFARHLDSPSAALQWRQRLRAAVGDEQDALLLAAMTWLLQRYQPVLRAIRWRYPLSAAAKSAYETLILWEAGRRYDLTRGVLFHTYLEYISKMVNKWIRPSRVMPSTEEEEEEEETDVQASEDIDPDQILRWQWRQSSSPIDAHQAWLNAVRSSDE